MMQPDARLRGTSPGALEKGFENVVTPLQRFIRDPKTGSTLLLCTVVALLIANSQLATAYPSLIEIRIGFVFGGECYAMSLRDWVNDGLTALFFFILGLGIKREPLVGELRVPARSLPVPAGVSGYLWLRLAGQPRLNR